MAISREQRLATELYRNLKILAFLVVLLVFLLALVPLKGQYSEWRQIQESYNTKARAAGLPEMEIGIKQTWRKEIGLADRCATCHLGMGPAAPLAGDDVRFNAHPEVQHDVFEMGCSVCHRGQARATRTEDAHGLVPHWNEPMLRKPYYQASCGPCHSAQIRVPNKERALAGQKLFGRSGCVACHREDEGVGPGLAGVGLKGYSAEWHKAHLRDPRAVRPESRMMAFDHLSEEEIDLLITHLSTLIGAPQLMRGKQIAIVRGCFGCHVIGDVGGDEGPSLEAVGVKPPTSFDYQYLDGEKTVENWHREHLGDPSKVSPGTRMPKFMLSPAEEDALITFLFAQAPEPGPEQLPEAQVRARLLGKRTFPTDGPSLFRTTCAICHGPAGKGKHEWSLKVAVPGNRVPEVLTVASRDFLKRTLQVGRPGRSMPAWGEKREGLRPSEIETLIDYLNVVVPAAPTFEAVMKETAEPSLGEHLITQACGGCHEKMGRGSVLAPSLVSPELRFLADDRYLYETITEGLPGTAMPRHPRYHAKDLRNLVGWIEQKETPTAAYAQTIRSVLGTDVLSYRARGSAASGAVLYGTLCVGCHGPRGAGATGPAIAHPSFLESASDGFIAGTIVLGRSDTVMRPFDAEGIADLDRHAIGDLITFLRSIDLTREPLYRPAQGVLSKGKEQYGVYCSSCHGATGKGGRGPGLTISGFLAAATDGFMQATIALGRPGTPMHGWTVGGAGFVELRPEDINNIVAFIRSHEARDRD